MRDIPITGYPNYIPRIARKSALGRAKRVVRSTGQCAAPSSPHLPTLPITDLVTLIGNAILDYSRRTSSQNLIVDVIDGGTTVRFNSRPRLRYRLGVPEYAHQNAAQSYYMKEPNIQQVPRFEAPVNQIAPKTVNRTGLHLNATGYLAQKEKYIPAVEVNKKFVADFGADFDGKSLFGDGEEE